MYSPSPSLALTLLLPALPAGLIVSSVENNAWSDFTQLTHPGLDHSLGFIPEREGMWLLYISNHCILKYSLKGQNKKETTVTS